MSPRNRTYIFELVVSNLEVNGKTWTVEQVDSYNFRSIEKLDQKLTFDPISLLITHKHVP
ncbi:hypothetical protein [Liquorilactobacillus aquaticus]|uniref:hypothetical protein n=1 Tax=Liquorilactobacillus aquaticus TaxID=392566 RepID=UPI00191BE154|nr:hypothetical protein [Liquorilactobacillus aquaticus]